MKITHQSHEDKENLQRVNDIERITGYKFLDPNSLRRALTHHSYEANRLSFERFVFLGDAFLNLGVGKEVFLLYPGFDSGKLTRLRAANVDTEKLARVALKHGLYKFLRHNISKLDVQIGKFREETMKYPLHSSGLIVAPKVLADVTESLIGAIFLDSNSDVDATWKAAQKLLEPLITPETLIIHPMTQLIEICDKWKLKWMYTDTWQDTGEYEFIVENRFFGKAKYSDKKAIAKNRAAFVVYHQILDELGEECDEPNIDPESQSHNDEENLKRAEDIQKITGYKFLDPNLLQVAFTHYEDNCLSFERFEFLGDAFLNLLIGREVYFLYPNFDPGKLTPLRAANVDTEKLARVALRHDLYKFLRHNIPSLDTEIAKFREETMEYPLHSSGLMDAPKVLADITESIIGAIYFDSNSSIDATWKVAKKLLEPLITPETLPVHPVSQLMKTCDKRKLSCMCNEDLWENTGEIEYVVGEKFSGKAKYSDKKVIARNRAAFVVYKQILEELDEESCNDQNNL